MNKFIANSSASFPLGFATGKLCLKVPGGQFANRIAIIYAASASNIALTYADAPYSDFSTPVNVGTDAADSPFDAWMDDNGDIYIAYTVSGTNDLACLRLTFAAGDWTAGSPVVVYNGDDNYYPSIRRIKSTELCIAYTRVSGGSSYISVKYSSDNGATWNLTSDPGDTLTSGATLAFGKLLQAGDYVYVFYTEGGSQIACRRKLWAAAIWNSEEVLSGGSGFNDNFAGAVSNDGRIGLAYAITGGIKFREYGGSAWSGEYEVHSGTAGLPVVSYQGGIAYVLFSKVFGANMAQVMYSKKIDNVFHTPEPLDKRKSSLARLLVYDASAGTYQDKTGQAASDNAADIFHGVSGALLADINDAVFFGAAYPIHFLNLILSTAGSGGEVIWKYWDGQAWQSFTPASGAWHFTTVGKELLLWTDYAAIPADWQKKEISGANYYWISATVNSAFGVPPVGTQISSVSHLTALSGQ